MLNNQSLLSATRNAVTSARSAQATLNRFKVNNELGFDYEFYRMNPSAWVDLNLAPDYWKNFSSNGSTDYTFSSADQYFLGTGAAQLVTGNNAANVIDGAGGSDTLSGLGGTDYLAGGDGNDALFGDGQSTITAPDGQDTLVGGAGRDTMSGNGGDDILFGDDARPDTVVVTNRGRQTFRNFSWGEADVINGGDGNDTAYGGGGNDTISGDKGNDVLFGNFGSDSILGGEGLDFLSGGEGIDTINAGAGNDTIYGGVGADVLTGGDGADVFMFMLGDSTNNSTDTITDFRRIQNNRPNDRIVLGYEGSLASVSVKATDALNNGRVGSLLEIDLNNDKTLDYRILVQGLGYDALVTNGKLNVDVFNSVVQFYNQTNLVKY